VGIDNGESKTNRVRKKKSRMKAESGRTERSVGKTSCRWQERMSVKNLSATLSFEGETESEI
jgi:hypothetical protein